MGDAGGADLHTRTSGVADHYAMDDEHALSILRSCVSHLNRPKKMQVCHRGRHSDSAMVTWSLDLQLETREPEEPLHDASTVYGIVGTNLKKTFEVAQATVSLTSLDLDAV